MKKSMLAVVISVLAVQGCTYYISSDKHSHDPNGGVRGVANDSAHQGTEGAAGQVLKSRVPVPSYMARSTALPVQGQSPVLRKPAEVAPLMPQSMVPPVTGPQPENHAESGFTPGYWAGFVKEGVLIILKALVD